MNHMTLDGVIQAPGRPDEDTRCGFTYGGWAAPSADDLTGKAMGDRMAAGGGLRGWLFGRRTYDDLLSYWTQQPDSPFGAALINARKYVVSSTLEEPLPWPNSTLLSGDPAEAVAAVKGQSDGVLAVMGSGSLIQALLPHNLVDEFLLMIHPLVLGTGRRLFPEGAHVSLRLTNTLTTATGVVIVTYEPKGVR
jgi:dihydrofolate reductase